MTQRTLIGTTLLLLAVLAPGLRAQPPAALELMGEGSVSRTLSAAELAALPQADVTITGRDSSRITFRGPTLRALMTLVGAPAGHDLRGPNMLLVVVAEASDGYKVVYALSDLDDQFSAGTAIVALTQNGGPLPAAEGPFRVAIGGGGEHRARWIRNLIRLRIVRVG